MWMIRPCIGGRSSGGLAFWRAHVGPQLLRPARSGAAAWPAPGPTAPLRPPTPTACSCPAGSRSRVDRHGRPAGRRAPATRGTPPPTAAPASPPPAAAGSTSPTPSRRPAPAAPARCASSPTARSRRLPRSSRHEPQLRRRPHAVGHVAVVRGERHLGPVYECDPQRRGPGRRRDRRGSFQHEAAAVDPVRRARVPHRGRPRRPALPLHPHHAGATSPPAPSWRPASPARRSPGCRRAGRPPTAPRHAPTRRSTAARARGSPTARCGSPPRATAGCGSSTSPPSSSPSSTTTHHRRRAAHRRRQHHRAAPSGDLFVAEDGGNMELCLITTADAQDVVAPFLRIVGHSGLGDHRPGLLARRHPALLQLPARHRRRHRRHLRDHRPVPHRSDPASAAARRGGAGRFGRTVSGGVGLGGRRWGVDRGGPASSFSVSGGVGRVAAAAPGRRPARRPWPACRCRTSTCVARPGARQAARPARARSSGLTARRVGTTDYRLRAYLRPA